MFYGTDEFISTVKLVMNTQSLANLTFFIIISILIALINKSFVRIFDKMPFINSDIYYDDQIFEEPKTMEKCIHKIYRIKASTTRTQIYMNGMKNVYDHHGCHQSPKT